MRKHEGEKKLFKAHPRVSTKGRRVQRTASIFGFSLPRSMEEPLPYEGERMPSRSGLPISELRHSFMKGRGEG